MLRFVGAAIIGVFVTASSVFAQPATQPHRTAKTLIVLAGDSTTAMQNGWGPGFEEHLVGDIQCINMARNGRSTKSFINEGLWKQSLDLKPDYILIQFGHNDQKVNIPTLGTDPQTTFKENLTKFVTEARAIGAKPILITSVSRRRWGDDGKTHSDLFDYANPVKELAPQLKVPLIDLHALSIELYDKLGKDAVDKLEANYGVPSTNPSVPRAPDHTHFNHAGAQVIGGIVVDQLKKAAPELAANIK